ncbi:MAG: Rne/Rng family ribonuclease [Deltaproteobacteria bacterium]|nr:Rne/Rng family ribonuclease [Deltaproteobacteria bacterium]
MSKVLLINTVNPEESRAAVIEKGVLIDLEIESSKNISKKGNIYKGKVTRVESSLQAGFIDIGLNRNGFLQIQELNPYLLGGQTPKAAYRGLRGNIKNYLRPGQDVLVQVVKDETEAKGAMLSMNIAMPGKYTVLLVGNPRTGVSKRVRDRSLAERFQTAVSEVEFDKENFGLIARTSAVGRTVTELSRDIKLCLGKWERIETAFEKSESPSLLYSEAGFPTRIVREYFTSDILEIVTDTEHAYNEIKDFIEETMPRYRNRLKLYNGDAPLFHFYGIEDEVQKTFSPTVELESGGFIVIEPLESLVAIDVNSGKAKSGQDFETNAFLTNLEAVREIARQLRLRDLGGLIIIDLIDMKNPRNIREIERILKQEVMKDRARVEVGEISKFGLVELSRQRIRASVNSQMFSKCPYCLGSGKLRGHELVALDVVRKIQSAVVSGKIKTVTVRIALAAGLYLLNFRKRDLAMLENKFGCEILILPDERFRPDQFEIDFAERKPELPRIEKDDFEDEIWYKQRVATIHNRWRSSRSPARSRVNA